MLITILLITSISTINISIASDDNAAVNKEHYSFTLTGNITSGNPDLDWNLVSGATTYIVKRLPVPATGYSSADFEVSSNTFIDEDVDVINQGSGFCQIRYKVEAYDGLTLLDTSNTIDYINDCL